MNVDDEVKRATRLLETVMQAAGMARKELDGRLGAGPGYISQVLTGRMELKFRHILAILKALDVSPAAFFQALFSGGVQAGDAATAFLQHYALLTRDQAQPHRVDLEALVRKVVSEELRREGR